jgi:two-component system, LytTR family, sensor kinase
MRRQWYTSKWAVFIFHMLPWILVFILPLLAPNPNHGQNTDWNHTLFNRVHVGFFCSSAVIFYLNAYFFIPYYYYKGRRWHYLTMVLVSFLGFLILSNYLFQTEKNLNPVSFHWGSLLLIVPFLFLWTISMLFRLASDKVKTDRMLKEKENENLKTELSFLRSQVSPHFLFNVLNNMVAMARLKSDKLEPSLIKLSGLMRYMLYESDEEKVPLAKEIEYVSSYIDLQKLRYGTEMKINVQMNDREEYRLIEPMLLIPFVENAFKHGTGMINLPEIDICLDVKEGQLDFRVKNKYNADSVETKDRTSGIGLNNVIRRLNLLYDKRHKLSVDKEDGWFNVLLQIKLQ